MIPIIETQQHAMAIENLIGTVEMHRQMPEGEAFITRTIHRFAPSFEIGR